MKLLPKSEVTRLKAVESKTAIDEGLKLARRVDNLREVAAAEEVSLETFRVKTVEKIHEETKEAAKGRDEVKAELSRAKDELAEARKPLDEEWLQVADIKSALDRQGESLDARSALLSSGEQKLERDRVAVAAAEARAKGREELAAIRLKQAEEDAATANASKSDAQKALEAATREIRDAKNIISNREKAVKGREDGVTMREEAVAKAAEFIREEKLRLIDRENTLARNLNRINKQNG